MIRYFFLADFTSPEDGPVFSLVPQLKDFAVRKGIKVPSDVKKKKDVYAFILKVLELRRVR